MTGEVIKSAEDRLNKTLDALKKDYGTLRAGRAAPSLLDKVTVDYYGTATPVNQIANVTIPEPRMIMIKPYDKSSLKEIEKAIQKSDLGLTPNNDGTAIRLTIPQPTQERRKELVKIVNKKAEEAKVAMRNIRRDANESIKKLEKGKQITEDDRKDAQEKMQKLLDKFIKLVDGVKAAKEKEVMEV
ncbi:MAG: ribosome recycling factor [Selenomonadaceae bacterium]|nr:ribosome recycling factor [Selenomonadaceae bacterium]